MGKKSKRKTKTKPPVAVDDVTITSDEALFKDPPAKEDCPICFLPMPVNLISCASLIDRAMYEEDETMKEIACATVSELPIKDLADANEELAKIGMKLYYPCCGKSICRGCVYSFAQSGNDGKCPFCNSDQRDKTDEEHVEQMRKRVAAQDATSMCMLAESYFNGEGGVHQDRTKAIELFTQAAQLGFSRAHCRLGHEYHKGEDRTKAKFHWEAAAMAGEEMARNNLGSMEFESGNTERAVKHLTIAASAGNYSAMYNLQQLHGSGVVSRESIDSTLAAYNNSCAEVRSEARDAYIRVVTGIAEIPNSI
jgi:TPR repeat protein